MPPAAPISFPRSAFLQRGSILVESLVALVLLSVALLMGLPLLFSQPGAVRRLDAQRVALGALDSTLEALRTGALPLQPARYGAGTPDDPVVWVEVEPQAQPAGLFRVTLRAVYQVRNRTFERQVETLVWKP
jgi:type II secretory pathway pseudopilin PulG